MTNQEAYIKDLDEIEKCINSLLSMIPVGKGKKEIELREVAEEIASNARTNIHLMKNDYIPVEM